MPYLIIDLLLFLAINPNIFVLGLFYERWELTTLITPLAALEYTQAVKELTLLTLMHSRVTEKTT